MVRAVPDQLGPAELGHLVLAARRDCPRRDAVLRHPRGRDRVRRRVAPGDVEHTTARAGPHPRVARVREIREWDQPDTTAEAKTKKVIVDYDGADGKTHTAWLGDLINEASIDQFTPASRWQVYAFADPDLADTIVLLTEAHDDVWHSGFMITGLHGDREFTDLRQSAAGSPFLNGKRRFVS